MLIEEIMNQDVATLYPTQTLREAAATLREKKIRHIAVIDEHRKVVGVITDRDIKQATPSNLLESDDHSVLDTPIERIMTKNPITGHPLDFVEETATIFYDNRIGCLPIVSKGKLVGMITESDMLYKFIELTGVTQPGSQIEIRVPNKSGVLYEVSKVFYQHKVNVLSVLVYPDKQDETFKVLVIRVKTINPLKLVSALEKEGFDVLWPSQPTL
ncbi:acetoin utilization protein AcuB [Chryseomicrobium excrementi]|uniref:Acetoin utilization protein AcuB n=1 Tax=Chryseomicrobium excrementi TaxID=2041346 RepID=A0A2M9F1M3_9BACL|nr:acetoin utilization AcuB family protein [Chryseomicrobium excrementi]PJK17361.1 acetoin utilization protein AcuB [Chryseomicrobium excrementi]